MEKNLPEQVICAINTPARVLQQKQNCHLVVKIESAEVSSFCSPSVPVGEGSLLRHTIVIKYDF